MRKIMLILFILTIFASCTTTTHLISKYSGVVIENKTNYDLVIIVNSSDTLRIKSGELGCFLDKGEKRINNSFEIYFTYKKKTRYKYAERVFTSEEYITDVWIIRKADLF